VLRQQALGPAGPAVLLSAGSAGVGWPAGLCTWPNGARLMRAPQAGRFPGEVMFAAGWLAA
jgi:hypothetical protein